MSAATMSLRAQARALSDRERRRRLATVLEATDLELVRAVVAAGVGGGEWHSTGDCAERALAVDPRTLRRWLAEPRLVLPEGIRHRLERLAFAFAVEVPS